MRNGTPLQGVYVFADGFCNFAIAYRQVDVGIDPYRGFALSPFGCAILRLHSAREG